MLFSPEKVGIKTAQNRLMRSPTWEQLADASGQVNDTLLQVYRNLKGLGIVVVSHAYTHKDGKGSFGQLGIDHEGQIPGLSRLAQAIHDNESLALVQINHAGVHARPELTGRQAAGPSPFISDYGGVGRALGNREIHDIIRDFGLAGARAESAGFDGVHLHACHSYLIHQFLCPAYNVREDAYGGSVAHRLRFFREVLEAIREKVSDTFILSAKLTILDMDGGCATDDIIEYVLELEKLGLLQMVEFSGGNRHPVSKLFWAKKRSGGVEPEEGYFEQAIARYRPYGGIPVASVGGYRTYEKCASVIESGLADFVALSRPLICEPDLALRWKNGDKRRAHCVSCNACLANVHKGNGLACLHDVHSK